MLTILRLHFFFINLITFVSLVATYPFIQYMDDINRITLLLLLLNNLFFASFFFKYLKLNIFIIMLIIFVQLSLVIGIYNFGISDQTITDYLMLFVFLFKVFVFRELINNKIYYLETQKFLRQFMFVALSASILATILFYFRPAGAYLGITPNVSLYLSYSLSNIKIMSLLLLGVLIFLSGKRAIIVSTILASIFSYFWTRSESQTLIKKLFLPVAITLGLIIGTPFLIETRAFDKILYSIGNFDFLSRDFFYIILAQRYFEIESITSIMTFFDWIIGKGMGFNYILSGDGILWSLNHNNAHFTPISILSKYGIFIFISISYFFIKAFLSKKIPLKIRMIFKIYLIIFLIESIFSYLIFNDRILPIILGMLLANNFNFDVNENNANTFSK
mgnify:CR=1 FL=1